MKCSIHGDDFVKGCDVCEDLAERYNYPLKTMIQKNKTSLTKPKDALIRIQGEDGSGKTNQFMNFWNMITMRV